LSNNKNQATKNNDEIKKSMKNSIKKKSTNKTKWRCQNPQIITYKQDNPIEVKTYIYIYIYIYKQSLILKRIWILKDKIKKKIKKKQLLKTT